MTPPQAARTRQLLALTRTALRHPSALRALARWKPFSVTSFEMARALQAQGIAPLTVIDAGANVGQFARAMAETFPDASVLSIEALPAAAARFRDHLGAHPRVRLVETAVGSRDGLLTFYPQVYDLTSSALRPVGERSRPPAPIEVPVARLDTLLADEDLREPTLLKLDLQGYELEALRGAHRTLSRVQYVLLEISFRAQYEGEPTFEELHGYLVSEGLRFSRPIDFLEDDRGEIVQMDALFERAGPHWA